MEMRLGARRLLPTRLSLQLLFLTSAGQQHPHGALDLTWVGPQWPFWQKYQ